MILSGVRPSAPIRTDRTSGCRIRSAQAPKKFLNVGTTQPNGFELRYVPSTVGVRAVL